MTVSENIPEFLTHYRSCVIGFLSLFSDLKYGRGHCGKHWNFI